MGTNVNNLQILGITLDEVKSAMPNAIVGKWSERFVTACPGELAFSQLERKAGGISKKLDCTVFTVSLFDSDMLSLSLYVSGKRTARHVVNPEMGELVLGNAVAFCSGLGLMDALVPDVKRLLTVSDQDEKLQIFAALLGAPLFACWDEPFVVPTYQLSDESPLRRWVAEHPLPPKIKNQTHAEVVQEIGERMLSDCVGDALILRPLAYADEYDTAPLGSVVGHYCVGGEWTQWNGDGQLVLTSLAEDGITDTIQYAEENGRLLTVVVTYDEGDSGIDCSVHHSILVADSAGHLPLPLPLSPDDEPAVVMQLCPLPKGEFLVSFQPQYDWSGITKEAALCCYGRDGTRLWVQRCGNGLEHLKVIGTCIYFDVSEPEGCTLRCLDLNGKTVSAILSCSSRFMESGSYLYQLKVQGYQKDDILRRFTLNLEDAGCLSVPYMSGMAVSSDGANLLCAGYGSGLTVIELEKFKVRREVRSRDHFSTLMADGKNRFWVVNGGAVECYSVHLELISRHRLAGEVVSWSLNRAGELCLATFQRSKHLTRVYRIY